MTKNYIIFLGFFVTAGSAGFQNGRWLTEKLYLLRCDQNLNNCKTSLDPPANRRAGSKYSEYSEMVVFADTCLLAGRVKARLPPLS
jgi:hypothetical protein